MNKVIWTGTIKIRSDQRAYNARIVAMQVKDGYEYAFEYFTGKDSMGVEQWQMINSGSKDQEDIHSILIHEYLYKLLNEIKD